MNTTFNNQKTMVKNFALSSLSLALAPLLLTAAHAAQADTLPTAQLPTINITATTENSIDSSLPNATVIGTDELNNPKVNDLASALENQTSINIDTNRDGDAIYMSIRGMGENNTDVKIDGIDVPSYLTYGHSSFNTGELNPVEIDTLKQIDIVKGHQSAKQDGSALAGSVNMRTYRPSDFVNAEDPTYASIKSGYNSKNDGYSNTFTGAYASGNLSGMIMYTNRNYHELDNMGDDYDKTLRNEADYQQNNVLLKGELAVNKGKLIATGEYFDFEKETNPRYTNVVNYKEPAKRKRLSLEGEFDNVLGLDEVNTNIAYQKASNSSRGWSYYTRQFYRGDFNQDYVGVSADALKNIKAGNIDHGLQFGLGYNQKDFSFDRVEETSGKIGRTIPKTNRDIAFAYLKDNIEFSNGFMFAPGVRVERKKLDFEVDRLLKENPAYDASIFDKASSETKVLPSLSLIAPVNNNLKVYASYAEGSKTSDDANFVTYNHGFLILPNPDLEDEESKNIEVGLAYQADDFNINLNGFRTKYDNFIGNKRTLFNGQPASMPFNIKDVKTQGVELASNFKVNDSLTASLAATWIDADSKTEGSDEVPLIETTPLIGNVGLAYSPNETWGGKLNIKMASKGKDPENEGDLRTPGFATTDVSAWWKPTNSLTLSGGVYNLFDKKYWNASDINGTSKTNYYGNLRNFDSYTQPGRNFGIKAKYEF